MGPPLTGPCCGLSDIGVHYARELDSMQNAPSEPSILWVVLEGTLKMKVQLHHKLNLGLTKK